MKFKLQFLIAAALAALIHSPVMAQDNAVSGDDIRAALSETLPSWWRITRFESSDYTPPAVEDGRDPKNPVELTSDGKPRQQSTGQGATHEFAADLELTDDLFEEDYSEGGATFVQELMSSGARLQVTGTYGAARENVLQLDQAGLDTLGRAMSDFEGNALLIGSPEADAFIEGLEAARVSGTLSKLMNDEGDEL